MTSTKPYIQIRTNSIIIEKFRHIAEEEGRSISNLGEQVIKQYIKRYELENGTIETSEQ